MGRQREVQMRCWWDAGGRGAAVTPALNSLHSYLPQVEPCCCAVRVAVPWCALLMLLLSPQTCSKAQRSALPCLRGAASRFLARAQSCSISLLSPTLHLFVEILVLQRLMKLRKGGVFRY